MINAEELEKYSIKTVQIISESGLGAKVIIKHSNHKSYEYNISNVTSNNIDIIVQNHIKKII